MNINYNNPKEVIRGFWGCSLRQDYRGFNFGEAFMLFEERIDCKLRKMRIFGFYRFKTINRLKNLYDDLYKDRRIGLLHKKRVLLIDKIIHEQHKYRSIFGKKVNIGKIREEFEDGL